MNNSIEQSSIPPRGSEVVTADTYIAFSHLLGPQQKPLLGCHVLGLSCHMDVRDLQAGKMTFSLILLRTCVITDVWPLPKPSHIQQSVKKKGHFVTQFLNGFKNNCYITELHLTF